MRRFNCAARADHPAWAAAAYIVAVRIAIGLLVVLLSCVPAGAEEARLFVGGNAFKPLTAAPRWPQFTLGYARVLDGEGIFGDETFGNAGYSDLWQASFGDSVAFYSGPGFGLDTFELGVQAALFATLDLQNQSQPLINADYMAGGYVAGRAGRVGVLTRVYHISSHLGDELLLFGPPVFRKNFSYESWETFVDYEGELRGVRLRPYAGGGWIFHETGPDKYGDLSLQYGLDAELPYLDEYSVVPFAAVDVQHLQSLDWQADVSAQLGVRLRQPDADGGQFSIALTYYDGRNPSGQFFVDDLRTAGVAIRYSF